MVHFNFPALLMFMFLPLGCFSVSFTEYTPYFTPMIQIDDIALHSWKHDKLTDMDVMLTDAAPASKELSHHVLASRALVRTRLRQWNAAIDDAKKVSSLFFRILMLIDIQSINVKPFLFGYIVMSFALVGNGEKHKAYRACDIAFQHCHLSHVPFLLLLKVCVPRSCTCTWFSQTWILPRLSSYSWPESMTMQYPA